MSSIKVVVIGDRSVGKTSWVNKLSGVTSTSSNERERVVKTSVYTSYQDEPFNLTIYDCNHEDELKRYSNLKHLEDADALVIVWDVTAPSTLANALLYERTLNVHCEVYTVGTKADRIGWRDDELDGVRLDSALSTTCGRSTVQSILRDLTEEEDLRVLEPPKPVEPSLPTTEELIASTSALREWVSKYPWMSEKLSPALRELDLHINKLQNRPNVLDALSTMGRPTGSLPQEKLPQPVEVSREHKVSIPQLSPNVPVHNVPVRPSNPAPVQGPKDDSLSDMIAELLLSSFMNQPSRNSTQSTRVNSFGNLLEGLQRGNQ